MATFGYLILISINFSNFIPAVLLALVSIMEMCQRLNVEFRQKCSTSVVFLTYVLLEVCKSDEKLSLVFDILHEIHLSVRKKIGDIKNIR